MDTSKLAMVSTENLMEMQKTIETILDSRLDTEPRRGRTATFVGSDGLNRTIIIERINGKTVSGVELAGSVKPGSKWRVGKSVLKVTPQIKKDSDPVFKAPHVPSKYEGDAW